MQTTCCNAKVFSSDQVAFGIDFGTCGIIVSRFDGNKLIPISSSQYGSIIPTSIVIDTKDNIATLFKKYMAQQEVALLDEDSTSLLRNEDCIFVASIKKLISALQKTPCGQCVSFNYFENFAKFLKIDDQTLQINSRSGLVATINLVKILSDVFTTIIQQFPGIENAPVIVTVPVCFSDTSRKIVHEAFSASGFLDFKMITEPVAAAYVYGADFVNFDEKYSLVFDWGGGTLDFSVLKMCGSSIEIMASSGELDLGGFDIDIAWAEKILNLVGLHKESIDYIEWIDFAFLIRANKEKLSLLEECSLNFSAAGRNFSIITKRTELEEISQQIIDDAICSLSNCLDSMGITRNEVSKIFFSGGSANIPRLRSELINLIPFAKHFDYLPGEFVVSYGAALFAFNSNFDAEKKVLLESLSLPIFVEVAGELPDVLFDCFTPVPSQVLRTFAIQKAEQTHFAINIYRGFDIDIKQNNLLAKFEIEIERGKMAIPTVCLEFAITINAKFVVSCISATDENCKIKLLDIELLSSF